MAVNLKAYGYNTPYVDASLRIFFSVKVAKFDRRRLRSKTSFCALREAIRVAKTPVCDRGKALVHHVLTQQPTLSRLTESVAKIDKKAESSKLSADYFLYNYIVARNYGIAVGVGVR